jgi:hypothetical protein
MTNRALVRLAVCVLAIASASACFSVPVRKPLPEALANTADALDGIKIRTWGDEIPPGVGELLALTDGERAERYPALVGRPHHYLAISGGGANGAFGAGLLVGWTAAGNRPEFTVVTGISTGALMAPFVFLGPDYDDELRELYTKITTEDVVRKRNFFARILADSAMDSAPLAAMLEECIDEALMEAIAAEYAKGRSLFIGTTNLEAARPVIWNIGRIARSGHPEALDLIRRVMLASASIPGVFPPVLLEVEAEGQTYDELHVDGGVTSQVFLYPSGLDWARLLEDFDVPSAPRVYIIRNSRLEPRWHETRNKAVPIVGRSITSLTRTQGIGDLYRLFVIAKRDGLDYNLAFIPGEFDEPRDEMFDPEYMQGLFDLGYRMAKDGYPWSKTPPEMEGTIELDEP